MIVLLAMFLTPPNAVVVGYATEDEDQPYKLIPGSPYSETLLWWMYNGNWSNSVSKGDGALTAAQCGSAGEEFSKSALDTMEVHHVIKGNKSMNRDDWAEIHTQSAKIYVPGTESTFPYSVKFEASYICKKWKKQAGNVHPYYTVMQSYVYLEAYDALGNTIAMSAKRFTVDYDNRPGHQGHTLEPQADEKIHSIPAVTLTISHTDVSFIRIHFVTKGSWLWVDDCLDIMYGRMRLTYPLFCGMDFDRGDSNVVVSREFPSDCDIKLELHGGAINGRDWGYVSVQTPFLYYNNMGAEILGPGHFEIMYYVDYWNVDTGPQSCKTTYLKGYFKVYYYDKDLQYIGTDIETFIHYDTIHSPPIRKTPTIGRWTKLSISEPTDYNAKYVMIELKLEGSYLAYNDGIVIKFKDLEIAGGGGYCTELIYYYESDYDDSEDIDFNYWFPILNYLYNHHDYHLFIVRGKVDDNVNRNDFKYANDENDLRNNDVGIYLGHGGFSWWPITDPDSYLYLTNGDKVDDDNIGNWGPETEFVILFACMILKDNQHDEWAVHGLYSAHAVLGFKDETDVYKGDMALLLKKMVLERKPISQAFIEMAMTGGTRPYREIWDASWQYSSDLFYFVNPIYGDCISSDESYDDNVYYRIDESGIFMENEE
ncbi:MAG: hypothetical protein J7L88_05425 [Thermoplasmata archaeon]|nr:hypothetical protein [Thermoplasmata archaeon]